ncbi:MAG: hypothetical protein FJW23_16020 [Acidimicrobiia bacterium]|nr:hypothetical protein [Acidimicrobiia bacterium]
MRLHRRHRLPSRHQTRPLRRRRRRGRLPLLHRPRLQPRARSSRPRRRHRPHQQPSPCPHRQASRRHLCSVACSPPSPERSSAPSGRTR